MKLYNNSMGAALTRLVYGVKSMKCLQNAMFQAFDSTKVFTNCYKITLHTTMYEYKPLTKPIEQH